MVSAPGSSRPLVALSGRRLPSGRVQNWSDDAVALQARYLDSVQRAGADCAIVDPRELTDAEAQRILRRFDALVLTGGAGDLDPATYGAAPHPELFGCDPAADAFELALCRAALDAALPTLGICRGLQVVNVALGGSLHQHLPDVPGADAHGRPGVTGGALLHTVDLEPGSLLAEVMGTTRATCTCHHHQAADRLGEGLRVTARAADGIVEALELEGAPWFLAVQWHPEDTTADDLAQQAIFDRLVSLA